MPAEDNCVNHSHPLTSGCSDQLTPDKDSRGPKTHLAQSRDKARGC